MRFKGGNQNSPLLGKVSRNSHTCTLTYLYLMTLFLSDFGYHVMVQSGIPWEISCQSSVSSSNSTSNLFMLEYPVVG